MKFQIESLKSYVGKISEDDFLELATKIYHATDFLCSDYPKHKVWFFEKQLPRTLTPNGEILFVRDENKIIAVAFLKKELSEQKICTFWIQDDYRYQGIGTNLIEASMKILETTTPFITFPKYKLPQFEPLINKYNCEHTETLKNYYSHNDELCFNGYLTKNKKNFTERKKTY